jgi:uncharacterized protein with PIN domain
MTETEPYSRSELAELRADARMGRPLACPRCGASLEGRPVPPDSRVSYVRSRVWWMCPACRRSAVLDARDGVRGPEGGG